MDKQTKVLIAILAIFVIGMTMSVAFAEPVSAAKYKNKKYLTVKVKDGKKTIKVKTKYKSSYNQYLGHKKVNGYKYYVYVCKDGKWRTGCEKDSKYDIINIKHYKGTSKKPKLYIKI